MFIYGEIVQIEKGYTFCHIKSLWKQCSSPILNTSEWCVNFYLILCSLKKFDFYSDPEMDPEPDPELSEKSDPDPENNLFGSDSLLYTTTVLF